MSRQSTIELVLTMVAALSPQEKFSLIKESMEEVLKPEILEHTIIKQKRPLVIY